MPSRRVFSWPTRTGACWPTPTGPSPNGGRPWWPAHRWAVSATLQTWSARLCGWPHGRAPLSLGRSSPSTAAFPPWPGYDSPSAQHMTPAGPRAPAAPVCSAQAPLGGGLTDEQVADVMRAALADRARGERVLVLVPDATRDVPMPRLLPL